MPILGIVASSKLVNVGTNSYLAISTGDSPFIHAYTFNSVNGFGTKFSNPATLPVAGNSGEFSPSGADYIQAFYGSPQIHAYPFSASGFGAKYANPATLLAGNGLSVAWHPSGDAVAAMTNDNTPYQAVYPWTSGTGFGTKYANPGTLPTGARSAAFSSTNLAFTLEGSPYVRAYPFTVAGGYGTVHSAPATTPTGYGLSSDFSPSGNDLAVGHYTSPYITVYPFSGSGFGTKYSNPATLPAADIVSPKAVKFNHSGNTIAMAHSSSPFVSVYPWSSGFGTKYSNPATLPPSTAYGTGWSRDSSSLAVAHANSPYISVYPWSSGFGTKYSNAANPITDYAISASFRNT